MRLIATGQGFDNARDTHQSISNTRVPPTSNSTNNKMISNAPSLFTCRYIQSRFRNVWGIAAALSFHKLVVFDVIII